MRKMKLLAAMLLFAIGLTACTAAKNDPKEQEKKIENNNSETTGSTVNSTKNVTRLDVNDVIEAAVTVSKMIWPATEEANKPGSVILAPSDSWQIALASANFIHHPTNGPILFYEKESIPAETLSEIKRLAPIGSEEGVEVIVMGKPSDRVIDQLKDYEIKLIEGEDAAEFAGLIDESYAEVTGELPQSVIIVSQEEDDKLFSIIAANWIAHMPEPVLYVTEDGIPEATKKALSLRDKSGNIYILGPESVISNNIEEDLKEFGTVKRIEGETPVAASIAFAKYKDEETGFGWGITEPGHGLGIISTQNAEFGIAGAPFAHLGKHAPLIWIDGGELTDDNHEYFVQLQPTFSDDPTVGPYNHAYVIGSGSDISMKTQGMLDQMLEISPEKGGGHGH